ncbi:MAG: tetratricopeptide repeat protein, partial [Steroidobacteraceae bacterium]
MGRRLSTPRSAASGHVQSEPYLLAQALYAHHRWTDAETLCRAILKHQLDHPGALTLLGIMLAQSKRTGEAADFLGRAARRSPLDAVAQINHGNVLRDLGQSANALACYQRAIALAPDDPDAHYNLGLALSDLRRLGEALASFERAIALESDYAEAYANRGVILRKLERFDESLASLDRAIAIRPEFAQAHFDRGLALVALTRLDEALASYDRAITIEPQFAEAHFDRGVTLTLLERFDAARESLERATELAPDHARAHRQLGNTLRRLRRFDAALACFGRSLAIEPQCAETHFDCGLTLVGCKVLPEALKSFDRALALGRRDVTVHRYRGAVLQELNRAEEAILSYAQALALDPRAALLSGKCRHARMEMADWEGIETDLAAIGSAIEHGKAAAPPFVLLSLLDAPALHRKAAEIWVRDNFVPCTPLAALPRRTRRDKIRIGYFSADFRDHPVARLAAGLFEMHDRSGFDLTAFSLGPDVHDELRARVEAACERFLRVDGQSDAQVAMLARELEIDIAVDLGGYTGDARPGILALRAAPIQVSYLG